MSTSRQHNRKIHKPAVLTILHANITTLADHAKRVAKHAKTRCRYSKNIVANHAKHLLADHAKHRLAGHAKHLVAHRVPKVFSNDTSRRGSPPSSAQPGTVPRPRLWLLNTPPLHSPQGAPPQGLLLQAGGDNRQTQEGKHARQTQP